MTCGDITKIQPIIGLNIFLLSLMTFLELLGFFFFMTAKNEVQNILLRFFETIQTQFHTSIKTMRFDSGKFLA